MNQELTSKPGPLGVHRWKVGVAVICLLLAISGTISWLETPESMRCHRLSEIHRVKADECRRLEQVARTADRVEEAQQLARSSKNFGWFAEAYRGRAARTRSTWVNWIRDLLMGK